MKKRKKEKTKKLFDSPGTSWFTRISDTNPSSSFLPRSLGDQTVRPPSDSISSSLVNDNGVKAEAERKEPILDWHRRRINDLANSWWVQPEDGHEKREYDCREKIKIFGFFVEGRGVLEDAQATSTRSDEVEPLHNNQIDEVDRGSNDILLVVVIRVDPVRKRAEAKPELLERNTLSLEVPK